MREVTAVRRRALATAGLAVLLVVGGLTTSAGVARTSDRAASQRAIRYAGTCQINGAATGYQPALSDRPASRSFVFHGGGQCTGGIVGSKTTTITVRTTIRGHTTVDSCKGYGITEDAAGTLLGTGSAAARALNVSFHADVFINGVTVTTAIIGDHGGAALGTGVIKPTAATLAACARGDLEILRFSLSMHTLTPFVIQPASSARG